MNIAYDIENDAVEFHAKPSEPYHIKFQNEHVDFYVSDGDAGEVIGFRLSGVAILARKAVEAELEKADVVLEDLAEKARQSVQNKNPLLEIAARLASQVVELGGKPDVPDFYRKQIEERMP